MYMSKIAKKLSLAVALTSLLSCMSVAAFAETAQGGAVSRGTSAAAGSYIDKSLYVDGSVYENAPPAVETVKIGLRYDTTAVSEADFVNTGGGGFYIGSYDENREFIIDKEVEAKSILVSATMSGGSWHILLEQVYDSMEKAENAAKAYGGFAAELDGEYRVLYGSYGSAAAAEAARDSFKLPGSAYTDAKSGLSLRSSVTGDLLYTAAADAKSLAIMPISEAEGLTEYRSNRYKGGFEIVLTADTRMSVINYVGLEDYVKGVIPYEMNYEWPYEALRAQAVCARTYVVYNIDEYAEFGFDITDDTYSQVYRGTLEANGTSDSAVDSTAGQLVRYKGEVCEIYYFASDGGATEDGKYVFESDRPYLTGKLDPFEDAVDYAIKDWSVWRSGNDLSWLLQNRGYEIGTITKVEPRYSEVGNVIEISFFDDAGIRLDLAGRACYTSIGLNSCRFTIEQHDDDFHILGDGWGHNCGMSQYGAMAMASVYGYDYEDIIRFYFTGAYIA